VIAYLKLSDSRFGSPVDAESIHALSDRLAEAIEQNAAGEFDGDEFGEGECTLFMYGPDADALFAAIETILRAFPGARGGRVIKRYGKAADKSAKQVSILL
jgi:hypothetical protein